MAPNSNTGNNSRKKKKPKKKSAPVPLAPPPHASAMKSRKKARQVTTLFHKYTREKDLALQQEGPNADTSAIVKELDQKIEEIGGRRAYQEASQLSTSFHSTSKWVLGCLQRKGWLYGIPIIETTEKNTADSTDQPTKSKRKRERRETKLLEVGAINMELLDAAERTVDTTATTSTTDNSQETPTKKYRLDVRAIDLHSMHPGRIEEADFLKLPLPTTDNQQQPYDVIVNSMVLNCVTTPEDRGEMLVRLFQFLRPGGILFLTFPNLCLSQSPYINRNQFLKLLGATGVGFIVEETKESPKVAFFVCRRPKVEDVEEPSTPPKLFDSKWTKLRQLQKGKKYRNQFAIVLNRERVLEGQK